jgi:hypothetical protein
MGYVASFREHGGEVLFVQLVAQRETLMSRVRLPDRYEHGKLVEEDALAEVLDRWTFDEAVLGESSLRVDTDTLDAEAAAEFIVEHLQLSRQR